MIEKAKDFYHKYWFIISSIVIALLYSVMSRRGQKIKDLLAQIQVDKIKQKLDDINRGATKDEDTFIKSMSKYEDLKRRHPDIIAKLSLRRP